METHKIIFFSLLTFGLFIIWRILHYIMSRKIKRDIYKLKLEKLGYFYEIYLSSLLALVEDEDLVEIEQLIHDTEEELNIDHQDFSLEKKIRDEQINLVNERGYL